MARPRKNTNKPVASKEAVQNEEFEKALEIDEPNERSSALAEIDLTEDQKKTAEIAARKDFLNGNVGQEEVVESDTKPLNKRAQKLLDDLNQKGVNVVYPSDFANWDDATFERLEKLNK